MENTCQFTTLERDILCSPRHMNAMGRGTPCSWHSDRCRDKFCPVRCSTSGPRCHPQGAAKRASTGNSSFSQRQMRDTRRCVSSSPWPTRVAVVAHGKRDACCGQRISVLSTNANETKQKVNKTKKSNRKCEFTGNLDCRGCGKSSNRAKTSPLLLQQKKYIKGCSRRERTAKIIQR